MGQAYVGDPPSSGQRGFPLPWQRHTPQGANKQRAHVVPARRGAPGASSPVRWGYRGARGFLPDVSEAFTHHCPRIDLCAQEHAGEPCPPRPPCLPAHPPAPAHLLRPACPPMPTYTYLPDQANLPIPVSTCLPVHLQIPASTCLTKPTCPRLPPHACVPTHACVHTCLHLLAQANLPTYTCLPTHAHSHMPTCPPMPTYTCSPAHPSSYPPIPTYMHIPAHSYPPACPPLCTFPNAPQHSGQQHALWHALRKWKHSRRRVWFSASQKLMHQLTIPLALSKLPFDCHRERFCPASLCLWQGSRCSASRNKQGLSPAAPMLFLGSIGP